MKIRYKKSMGIIFIVVGIMLSCIYFAMALNENNGSMLLTTGFLLILFGVLTLTRIYFEITENVLIIYAILGPGKTSYTFASPDEFEIEDNKVFLNQNGKRSKLPISAWMVEKQDWQLFIEKING
ncbi:MAG: hypothetical protein JEZ00_15625 [Anaerolineaceae bacterium]|nr:hypothetical protein [Anaerolineaceae bacterium]